MTAGGSARTPGVLLLAEVERAGGYLGAFADCFVDHREPLILCWHGTVPAGTRCDDLVCLSDLPATIAEIVGCPVAATQFEDGVSFLAQRDGTEPGRPAPSTLVRHSGAGVFSVRSGRWKLVHDSTGSGGWPPPAGGGPVPGSAGQLYDLREEPGEEHNLYEERPGIVRVLTEQLRPARTGHAGQTHDGNRA